MVRYLLSVGCDPDECFIDDDLRENTPWRCWLGQMRCSDTHSALLTAEITELFINAGSELSVAPATVGETLDIRIKRQSGLGNMELVRGPKIIREKGHNLLRLIHAR